MPASEINRIVVVAGEGRYPELLLDELAGRGTDVSILALPGFDPENRYRQLNSGDVSPDNFVELLAELHSKGHRHITFAGAVQRPQVKGRSAPDSQPASFPDIRQGDDAVLRSLVGMVESAGFEVLGGHEFLPGLTASAGILTSNGPSSADRLDAERAADIVQIMGPADIGQAAVVVCRLCVAVETVSGTNAMLEFAASTIGRVNPRPGRIRGVMYKGPKPGQELRLDMPAIGPQTVIRAADAGLAGIAIEAGSVLILDREATVAEADKHQMFIWARDPAGR